MHNPIYPARVTQAHDYAVLAEQLKLPAVVLEAWMDAFAASTLRMPGAIERESMAATVEPIVDALASVVALDRAGRAPVNLRFTPGSLELREVEKAVSFAAALMGADGFTGFDLGALLFALRDVLVQSLVEPARTELQGYMEWLAVLAADSLATGREQALLERMAHELDDGTPLLMITNELPAVLFVGRPNQSVVANIFGRLLLMVVRTGAKAVIIDVRGMASRLDPAFAEPLERFLSHPRVGSRTTVYACGVHGDDGPFWDDVAKAAGVRLVMEGYFDACVQSALAVSGWRIISPS